jgi:hypothetical protein
MNSNAGRPLLIWVNGALLFLLCSGSVGCGPSQPIPRTLAYQGPKLSREQIAVLSADPMMQSAGIFGSESVSVVVERIDGETPPGRTQSSLGRILGGRRQRQGTNEVYEILPGPHT